MITAMNISDIRNDMQSALQAVAEKYNLHINLGRIRYSEKELRCKLTALSIDVLAPTTTETASTETSPNQIEWNLYCDRYGLRREHYGVVVSLRGERYKLVQIKNRYRKYPIIAQKISTGRSYKWPAATVRTALGSAL